MNEKTSRHPVLGIITGGAAVLGIVLAYVSPARAAKA